MSFHVVPVTEGDLLQNNAVFLASSIPDPARWTGYFDAREITDAVVAAARAILTAGGVIVTGAHPTISPLLLYVAAEFPVDPSLPRIIVYQSGLFEEVMPHETKRFEELGVGYLRFTRPAPGDRPVPGQWDASLNLMRRRMFAETKPAAGIYIGGMRDINTEFAMINELKPRPQAYALAAPGGEAASLVAESPEHIQDVLRHSDAYPSIFRAVVADLAEHIRANGGPASWS